jgi:hypothetical protein
MTTDAEQIAELQATLEKERTEHAETRLAVLAMMAAVDEYVAQLRALVEKCMGTQT